MSAHSAHLDLVCHPDAADERVDGIRVAVSRAADGALALHFRLRGDLDRLAIPTAGSRLDPERLWAHTCFECFVAEAGAATYREFNFSPSGQWKRFDFSAYRHRLETPPGPNPVIEVESRPAGAPGAQAELILATRLAGELLPSGELVLGLTTVVEHADGGLRYWALRHPPGKPDFHHRDGFALRLAAP